MSAKRLNERPERIRGKTLAARPLRSASSLEMTVARERVDRYERRTPVGLDVLTELRSQAARLTDAQRALISQGNQPDRSSRARRTERERYQDLFNFSSDALLLTDRAGRVKETNETAAELLGLRARSIRGRDLAGFLRSSDRIAFRDALVSVVDSGDVALSVVFETQPSKGTRVDLNAKKTRDKNMVMWKLTASSVERTSDLPPPSIEHVETVVAQRTQALEGALRHRDQMLDQERRSRAELETASNAKDRSLAILSHELRAPVHAILGWTKLLRQTDIGFEARERGLAVIERNALSQAELVETLLDLSRIASNKMAIAQAPFDFADVVSMAVDSLRPEACRKRIALSSEIHRNIPVVGDALRLQQVVMNLVGNALRYTQPGGWVGVRVERRADVAGTPGAKAQLMVADSGRGVASDLMPRIFDCFQQGEEHPGQGLGLGLYLVRKFVEMHGGKVWAESGGENRGATFTVVLPSGELGQRMS